ncbi:NB-ARC domain protein [Frankia sp. R43]|uniref:FxSxx-COOH system tetratricopeptide repeat protein n=1 Tax=Frankia sp. R43 TaxID=269536 RepID=UPI0006CA3D7B|nr:FxSxx-COOH system tetratricopeptide repeat protein [Frankia sp. R43]KPM53459.1 NB-ARC domain protein [Frankia sp. R43]
MTSEGSDPAPSARLPPPAASVEAGPITGSSAGSAAGASAVSAVGRAAAATAATVEITAREHAEALWLYGLMASTGSSGSSGSNAQGSTTGDPPPAPSPSGAGPRDGALGEGRPTGPVSLPAPDPDTRGDNAGNTDTEEQFPPFPRTDRDIALAAPVSTNTRRLQGAPEDDAESLWTPLPWMRPRSGFASLERQLSGARRSLRPLRQTVASKVQMVLDEEATAERLLRGPAPVPVRRPAPERRWDLVLLVDDSPSMQVAWLDLVPLLRGYLVREGVFRDIRVCFVDGEAAEAGQVTLRPESRAGALHRSPREIIDPSGRRIIWVLTDGVGRGWHNGALHRQLWWWSRRLPVAVMNPLPAHLWHLTGLAPHQVSIFAAAGPGSVAVRWRFQDAWAGLTGGAVSDQAAVAPIPMLGVDGGSIASWARFQSAEHERRLDAPAVLVGPGGTGAGAGAAAGRDTGEGTAAGRNAGAGTDGAGARVTDGVGVTLTKLTPLEIVRRARATLSPAAFDLAVRLAAVPLTRDAIHMVCDQVSQAGRAELGEILVHRLLRPVTAAAALPTAADEVAFEFGEGVPAELLACGRQSQTIRTWRSAGRLLSPAVAALRHVDVVLDDPVGAPLPVITPHSAPFIRVEEVVLSALSGPYRSRALMLRDALRTAEREVRTDGGPAPRSAGSAQAGAAQAGVSGTRRRGRRHEVEPVTHSNDSTSRAPAARTPIDDQPTAAEVASADPGGGNVAQYDAPTIVTSPTAAGIAPEIRPPARRPGGQPAVWGNMPQRNPNFTGRAELLDALHERLQTGTTAVLPEALHGMGGVGKSQLAIEYVYRQLADYDVVWWIPSERTTQINQALVELAQRLGLGVGQEANAAVPAVIEALRVGKPFSNWLLIFDNADDPRAVRDFFPASGTGRILITSRNAQWAGAARALEVDVFQRGESVELLRRRTTSIGEVDADRVAAALGDLPLAIEQAATWLAETGMPADEYLRLFEDKRQELLGTAPPLDYRMPVRAAWNVSLDRLAQSNPAALRLLQVCAYFAPDPISRQVFRRGRHISIVPELDAALRDSFRLNEAIREINQYALARIDHRTNSLQMHRLVQAVLIGRMSPDEQETMRHGAHRLLAASDPDEPMNPEWWSVYAELYPHVIAAGAVEGHDPLIRDLLVNEVRYLWKWGDHEVGVDLARQAYESWRVTLGEEHPHTLSVGGWYGWLLQVVGNYSEAAPINTRMLELCEQVHGPRHPETLAAFANVTMDRKVSGDFAGAVELSETARERAVNVYGADQPQSLNAAHNLAAALRLVGDFRRAQEIDDDTWRRRCALLGEDNVTSLESHSSQNLNLRELGDYLGARARQEELVARLRALLGNEYHPDLLRALRNLAIDQRKAGDHDVALQTSRLAWERLLSRYGPDHPDTLAAILCYSMDLRHNGDLDEARRLCEDAHRRYRNSFGDTHPHTLGAETNLAVVYRLAGDAETAFEIDLRSCAALAATIGPDHPLALISATNLASDHYALGRPGEARGLDEDTLERSRVHLGADHPSTLAVLSNLAMDLRALGERERAEELHAQVVSQLDHALGVSHLATQSAMSWVRSDCDVDPMPL